MNRKTVRLASILVACTLLLFFPVGAASIGMIPSSVTIQKSGTAEISLVLDDAVSGLAGYDLVIRFSNPTIAEISEVTYPAWAALNNTTRKADSSVRISGVDLSRQVNPGMTAVPLANLKIRGISGGSSSISLESVNMDADGGAAITPTLPTGQITVPGGTTPSGGGGGGGGGSSVSSVTQSQTSPTPTSSPTAIITQEIPTVASQETIQPPLTTATMAQEQVGPYITEEVPESVGGIPWMWILGGIIVIGALIVVAFIAWRKEQEQG
ncbi:MAG: hypothetical protein QHH04_03405 [Methanolinea sp.]|jgi:hypothetical protein|nr:hypothetical protein [Methanolinea sp.]